MIGFSDFRLGHSGLATTKRDSATAAAHAATLWQLGTKLLLAAALAIWPACVMAPAAAQEAEQAAGQGGGARAITLTAGSGEVLRLPSHPDNVFTADPKVVEVRPASPTSLFVFGVAPGITTLAAMTANGQVIAQYQLTVLPSDFDAAQVRGAISGPGRAGIKARATETGVELSGHVPSPEDSARAVAAAKSALPADAKIENRMSVSEPIQVSLHVRIAEMTRTLTRALGVNWTAAANVGKDAMFGIVTNNAIAAAAGALPTTATANLGNPNRGLSLDTVIDALSQDELVHTLAEPNLTTMSGQPANFLVGGEFPIPVASQNNSISVEFKQYGISLSFVPTVMANNHISLHVRPEVSALDKADGVVSTLNSSVSISIPALTVRRADTTVELGSGQSFAIAGLLSDQTTQTIQSTPGLGDLPILGPLFHSDSFNRAETELVIIVTPYIVRPVSDPNALHLSSDGYHVPNDLERILQQRQLGRGYDQGYGRIPADAGFIVE